MKIKLSNILLKSLLLFLCLLSMRNLPAQTHDIFRNKQGEKEWVFKSLLHDHGKIWSAPFRMQTKDLKYVLPIVSLTAISIVYDEEIYREFKYFQSKNKWADDLSPIITYMGDDKTSLSVSGLFLISGLITKNDRATQTALMGFQTFVHAGLVIQVMKHLSCRQRPIIYDGHDHWYGPRSAFDRYDKGFSNYDAFPSGHTIIAWGMATVIAKQYREHKWVPISMYSLATLAGLSRVTEDTHWLSDVIVGGSLGYAIGNLIYQNHKSTNWSLVPHFRRNSTQVKLIYNL